MKNCERFTALFSDYAEDGLASAEKRELDVHLQQCSECRSAVTGVVNLRASLRQMPGLTTSSDFETILRTRIKMERRSHVAPMWSLGHFPPRRFAVWATAIVAVSSLFYLWPRSTELSRRPVSPLMAESSWQPNSNSVLLSVNPTTIKYTLDRVTPQLLLTFGAAGRSPKRAASAPADSSKTATLPYSPAVITPQPITF